MTRTCTSAARGRVLVLECDARGGVGESEGIVCIDVAASKGSFATVDEIVAVEVVADAMVGVTFIRDAVVVDIGIAGIDETITVGVRLTAVESTVLVTVWSGGEIDVARVGNAIQIDVIDTADFPGSLDSDEKTKPAI